MIDPTYFWTVVFMLAIGTILIRGSIIGISHRVNIPHRLKQIFSFIPAAILPALIAPLVFFHEGEVNFLWGKERMLVLACATLVCYFTRNMLVTIGFGMVALYVVVHQL